MSSSMGRIIPYIMEHKKWLKPPTRLDTDWNHKPDILIRRPAEKCWSFTEIISPHPHPSCKVATEFGLHLHRRHPGLNGLVKGLVHRCCLYWNHPFLSIFGMDFGIFCPPAILGKPAFSGEIHVTRWHDHQKRDDLTPSEVKGSDNSWQSQNKQLVYPLVI